jgi:Uma2 family endonuclease
MRRTTDEPAIRTRRWSREEYTRLIELGLLDEDEPIELLAGRLVVMEPQRTPHAVAIQLTEDELRAAFGVGWSVRVQLPLALDPDSEPEPDVAVVAGSPRDHLRAHPSAPALVVEVSHDSLRANRGLKNRLYARAAIQDYWIVNLVDRVVEVRRQPGAGASGRWRYRSLAVVQPGEWLTPLAAPAARIAADALLP